MDFKNAINVYIVILTPCGRSKDSNSSTNNELNITTTFLLHG